jgi:predicted PurR-regulated permease PerM
MENQSKENAPYSVAVLVLGICSFFGFKGFVCGIIALVLAHKSFEQYKIDPQRYKAPQMLKAGQICAIIGVSLKGFMIVSGIILAIIFGTISGFSNFSCLFDEHTLREMLHRVIGSIG